MEDCEDDTVEVSNGLRKWRRRMMSSAEQQQFWMKRWDARLWVLLPLEDVLRIVVRSNDELWKVLRGLGKDMNLDYLKELEAEEKQEE
jgi:hypothetical protein